MRHYKAAGFSDEVSRLAAAPRRPSTNRMYDDWWLRFARWAAGQGFDPLDPTAAQIASFLFTLFDTHGLKDAHLQKSYSPKLLYKILKYYIQIVLVYV